MPQFIYSGDSGRYYAGLGLSFNDGDVVTLDECPSDGRFTPAPSKSTKSAPAASTPESE